VFCVWQPDSIESGPTAAYQPSINFGTPCVSIWGNPAYAFLNGRAQESVAHRRVPVSLLGLRRDTSVPPTGSVERYSAGMAAEDKSVAHTLLSRPRLVARPPRQLPPPSLSIDFRMGCRIVIRVTPFPLVGIILRLY
jgi:hypothetical protein